MSGKAGGHRTVRSQVRRVESLNALVVARALDLGDP